MTASRIEYMSDLIDDCLAVVNEAGIDAASHPEIIASLIICDSVNGLRKALLTVMPTNKKGCV